MALANLNTNTTASAPASTDKTAMAVVTTLFFMWGFLTVLNDILIPHLKPIFDLNWVKVMLIQTAYFSGYLIFSVPAGKVIDWIGYKWSMVAGLFIMALGAFLFIPAAMVASYPLFLGALFVLSAGITLLQVSANPYVAVLGPPKTASSRLNLTQGFNSLGTTLAPYLGGLIILTALPSMETIRSLSPEALQAFRVREASSVKLPYLGLGLIAIFLGLAIAFYKLPQIAHVQHHKDEHMESIWKYRHVVLAAIGIFVYVGAEVSIGSVLIKYIMQPQIGNISAKLAATYLGFFYWGGLMVGRFTGSALLQKISPKAVLGTSALAAILLVSISMLSSGHLAMWSVILVGLFNSIMFPIMFTWGIAELGPLTSRAASLLVMAIVGGAVIPVMVGALADHVGIQRALILPAICYVYVLAYTFVGWKPAGPGISHAA
jgi:FHS family L-fucose permease-like MFS transporter